MEKLDPIPTSSPLINQDKAHQSTDITIELDVSKIDKDIRKSKISTPKPDFTFALYNPLNDTNLLPSDPTEVNSTKYIANIKSSFEYIGLLSESLKKEFFGLYKYEQGDIYLGEWKNDIKDGLGYYTYDTTNSEKHMYIGNWLNNEKNGNGVYIWKHCDASDNIKNCSYDAFIGRFENDKYTEGITITKKWIEGKENRVVYIGKFVDGVKKDENALIFENGNGFKGKYENDKMWNGRIVICEGNAITNSYGIVNEEGKLKFNSDDNKEEDDGIMRGKEKVEGMKYFEKLERSCEVVNWLVNKCLSFENFQKEDIPGWVGEWKCFEDLFGN